MKDARPWMSKILIAAGLYNLIYGAWVVLFPASTFEMLDMEPPRYMFLWQCIGMIVGVYGVGSGGFRSPPCSSPRGNTITGARGPVRIHDHP